MRIGVEPPYRRTARCAPRREGEVRERRLGELPRRALGEVLVRHAAEVGAQEALRQLVAAAAAGGGARDALDQRDARGGDAAEQPVLFNSNWRVHAQSSPGRRSYGVAARLYMPRAAIMICPRNR